MKLCFDIDGTVLTQGTPELDYRDAIVIPDMVQLINQLHSEGHEIYFLTARHFKHFKFTKEALENAGFKFDGLFMNKISCDLYIDDRGFRFNQNIDELKKLIQELK